MVLSATAVFSLLFPCIQYYSMHCMPTAYSLPACRCIFRLHAACTAQRLHAGMQPALHAVPTASGPGRLQSNPVLPHNSVLAIPVLPQKCAVLNHNFDALCEMCCFKKALARKISNSSKPKSCFAKLLNCKVPLLVTNSGLIILFSRKSWVR